MEGREKGSRGRLWAGKIFRKSLFLDGQDQQIRVSALSAQMMWVPSTGWVSVF